MTDNPTNITLVLLASSAVKVLGAWWIRRKKLENYELVGKVSSLIYYPVKSCKGISLTKANATVLGLKYDGVTDRHWMVTRANGDFVSIRQYPKMSLISLSVDGGCINLDAPGMPTLCLPKNPPVKDQDVKMTRVWDAKVEAQDCGDKASSWISKYLNEEGFRIFFSGPSLPKRDSSVEIKPWGNLAIPGDLAAFPDFGAYLVLSEASLDAVNQRLEKKVVMSNFRPNIVFSGCGPFEEDTWQEIRIGEKVYMRMLDLCTRCLMTTVDPAKGVKDPDQEPLKTLKKFRCLPMYGSSPCFGVNAALDVSGEIKVGDPVYALKK